MLNIKKISKSFRGKKVLDDVSLQAQPGDIVVMLGQSGVGKSTILRVLNDLECIDAGSIDLDGVQLDAGQVGMVFQEFNLFAHLTVEENITLPLIKVLNKSEDQACKIAHELLNQFDLMALAHHYPVSLSGGQKQRVAVARTVATSPRVLCLDEPTSALDPTLTTAVAQIIQKLAYDGFIVMIATHDTELLKQMPCTIHLMQAGKIIESTTSDQLYKNESEFKNIKNFILGKNASVKQS